jgi:hypothetical protein
MEDNYFNKRLKNLEKWLNLNIISKQNSNNSSYKTNSQNSSQGNTTEESFNSSNTKTEIYPLSGNFQINDIISWPDKDGIEKYGIIQGESSKGPKYIKIKRILINNNNVTNINIKRKNSLVEQIINKEIISVKKIGTYDPLSKKIIRSANL